jgi:hypothetical protein
MAEICVVLRVRVAWWVRWYVSACALFAHLHGVQPDADKIGGFVSKHGVKVEVDHGR